MTPFRTLCSIVLLFQQISIAFCTIEFKENYSDALLTPTGSDIENQYDEFHQPSGYGTGHLGPIFSLDFKFLFMDEGNGTSSETENEFTIRDETPTAFRMKSLLSANNNYQMTNEIHTISNETYNDPYDHNHHHNYNYQQIKERTNYPESFYNDYVDLNRNLNTKENVNMMENDLNPNNWKLNPIQPEVFILFDYINTLQFKKNITAIVDYLAIYFHGVNNRYATITEPKVQFKISGIIAVSSRNAQPFLERYKLKSKDGGGGGGYDINKVLDGFASWIYGSMSKLPRHHLAHLITGESMKTKDSISGNYIESISGLGYLNGACWISMKKSLATSIVQDVGGIWDGVFTSAHELAHNLGASHDGSENSSDCPWTDGYIMSYTGWGSHNKFYFSKCTIKSLRQFISSPEASCLFQVQNPSLPMTYQSDENSGERIDMKTLCKKYTANSLAIVDPDTTPSDLCKNLVCRYPDGYNGYYVVKINHPPGDNAFCGLAGRCLNGECQTKNSNNYI